MKKELLNILKSSLESKEIFNHVDLYEKISYESSDFPICIIKDYSDEIIEISSGNWKVASSITIDILNDEALEAIDLTNEVLDVLKNIPNDIFIFEIEAIDKESEYLEGLILKVSIHVKVSYFIGRFKI